MTSGIMHLATAAINAYILPQIHDVALMEDINVNGTKNVLHSAARHEIKQIMDCSSTTAYGVHPDNPPMLTEESPLRGNEDFIYAKNKRVLEIWTRDFENTHPDISLIVIRPCFVVGTVLLIPRQDTFANKFVSFPEKQLHSSSSIRMTWWKLTLPRNMHQVQIESLLIV